jgi:hypothetical protein
VEGALRMKEDNSEVKGTSVETVFEMNYCD